MFKFLAILLFVCISIFITNPFTRDNSYLSHTQKKIFSQAKEVNILFVGNSLTYTNNLPLIVKHKARKKGIIIRTSVLAHPNYALIDHWNDGLLQKNIADGAYDIVIVQQGPSSQETGRKLLFTYGKKLSKLCKDNGTTLAVFMVWPSLQNYNTFGGVIENYTAMAKENDAILCPVGEVWKSHFDNTNNFDYLGPDGFHPSKKGSEAAAEVIVNYLFHAPSK